MLEYRGYVIEQTDRSIFLYKNDRFVMHVSVAGHMNEDELMETVDSFIGKFIPDEETTVC